MRSMIKLQTPRKWFADWPSQPNCVDLIIQTKKETVILKSTNSLYLGGESQEARQTVNLKEILKNFLSEKYFWWLLESNVTRLTDLQLLVGSEENQWQTGDLEKDST